MIESLQNLTSNLFKKENISFAIHGKESSFPDIEENLTVLLGSMFSTYPEFIDKVTIPEQKEFETKYHQVFFKTPLAVNMCTQAFIGPTFTSTKDFAIG